MSNNTPDALEILNGLLGEVKEVRKEERKCEVKEEQERFAFVTGINGQDGSYLSELLLSKAYNVYGILRRHSQPSTINIDHFREKLVTRYGDMQDLASLQNIFLEIRAKMKESGAKCLEVYHLAAQSHVKVSFELPLYTTSVNAIGSLNILQAVKSIFYDNNDQNDIHCKVYNASTSEMYGKVQEIPQSENTPFYPRSPYACAKLFSNCVMKNYREAYDMFICNGILFNHESERRGMTFVTRKITVGIAKILRGEISHLELGNLNSKRDWSHAKDMVYGMYLMLQQSTAADYVLGSNENHSVREFVELAFGFVGIDIEWHGSDENEIGKDSKTQKVLIKINPRFYRPTEVDTLLGDSTKARTELQWKPKYSFIDLVRCMVKNDCAEWFMPNRAPKQPKSAGRVVMITGGTGLVGSALKQTRHSFYERKSDQFIFLSSKDCDLRVERDVHRLFNEHKPTHVIHLAANVGGLYKNMNANLEMFQSNIAINRNVLRCCHKYKVKQLISCLSTCIYPAQIDSYPITESDLHKGVPHESNEGYAFAKRMLQIETSLYNKQYSTNYLCITPTNIFGPCDNFSLQNGHVIPALIHKCYLAKQRNAPFQCFGSGAPLRQFIYSFDVAKLIYLLTDCDAKSVGKGYHITLTPSESSEVSIKSVAEQIAVNLGMKKEEIVWDKSKSDGQFKKTASNKRLLELFPDFKFTPFDQALKHSVEWFKNNYPNVRT